MSLDALPQVSARRRRTDRLMRGLLMLAGAHYSASRHALRLAEQAGAFETSS